MSGSTDNTVVVKFEVHVPRNPCPCGESAEAVSVVQSGGKLFAGLGGVTQPISQPLTMTMHPGTIGSICVTAQNDTDFFNNVCTDVWVMKIDPALPVPTSPPGGAVQATRLGDGGTSFRDWKVANLQGIVCAWPNPGENYPLNYIAIWRKYPNLEFWTIETRGFRAKCANTTSCS